MNAPPDIDDHLTSGKYCPVSVAIYKSVVAHWEVVKDFRYKDGSYIYWNFPRVKWTRDNGSRSNERFAMILHYDTIENAGSLKGSQHCASKMHSDGKTIVTSTWNWIKGEE